jgi:hypothetical protein
MVRNLLGDVGHGLMTAVLTPHDQPDLGGERLAEGHRRRLALASFPPHNPTTMPRDLTDDDKAILVELLRETIDRDRFPLSPKVKRLKAVLAKLDPSPAPAVTPLPPPKPPGERSVVLAKKRRR